MKRVGLAVRQLVMSSSKRHWKKKNTFWIWAGDGGGLPLWAKVSDMMIQLQITAKTQI